VVKSFLLHSQWSSIDSFILARNHGSANIAAKHFRNKVHALYTSEHTRMRSLWNVQFVARNSPSLQICLNIERFTERKGCMHVTSRDVASHFTVWISWSVTQLRMRGSDLKQPIRSLILRLQRQRLMGVLKGIFCLIIKISVTLAIHDTFAWDWRCRLGIVERLRAITEVFNEIPGFTVVLDQITAGWSLLEHPSFSTPPET